MPLYTYECKNCGQRFDARQSFSDDPLTTCPNCNGQVYRVIQPAAVVFKGSGFYVTDSKGKQNLSTTNGKKEEAASGDTAEKSTEKSSNGSDSGTSTTSTDTPAKPAAETKSTTSSTSSTSE